MATNASHGLHGGAGAFAAGSCPQWRVDSRSKTFFQMPSDTFPVRVLAQHHIRQQLERASRARGLAVRRQRRAVGAPARGPAAGAAAMPTVRRPSAAWVPSMGVARAPIRSRRRPGRAHPDVPPAFGRRRCLGRARGGLGMVSCIIPSVKHAALRRKSSDRSARARAAPELLRAREEHAGCSPRWPRSCEELRGRRVGH